ncbi:MAG: hypothetical protein R3F19_32705 [Verrucomicrobiales bacterium]
MISFQPLGNLKIQLPVPAMGTRLWHLAHFPHPGDVLGNIPLVELSFRNHPAVSRCLWAPLVYCGADYHIPVMLEEVVHFLAPS